MGRMTKKALLTLAVAAPVPAVILLRFLTAGGIDPYLPGHSNTWNIQYVPLLVVATGAAYMSIRWRQRLGPVVAWSVAAGNGLIAALACYAIFILWGEKY